MAEEKNARKNSKKNNKNEGTKLTRREFLSFGGGFIAGFAVGAGISRLGGGGAAPAAPASFAEIMEQRGLTQQDAIAALKTYTPGGKYDEFIMFASGGHSGQVLVIGVPSMRLYKVIAVFTPEPWQGYGYGLKETHEVLKGGYNGIRPLSWGDVHHPEISRTNAEFDGEWLFVNDKANGRAAVVSLKDFETKQIIKVPNTQTVHGGCFATPNTEYVAIVSQYATPWDPEKGGYIPGETYVELTEENYKKYFRGTYTFLAFDRKRGRFDLSRSFQIELPPYTQDLVAVGWGPSDGLAFCNSFNTELAVGGVLEGKSPLEVGMSQNDFDYLHIILWKKAEQYVREGGGEEINGIRVIRLKEAVKEGLIYFAPEPKSPHGCDITPNGDYVCVSGKLDPVVTVYSVEKIKRAIEEKKFEKKDPYGVPVLKFDEVVEAQIEVGLGPLHTEFDDKGYAYTSLFIDNAVARWKLGPPYNEDGWKVVERIPINYNVGHLATPESNSPTPKGKYLVSLNKWSIERFPLVGPLHPQNFQLIDISGPKMQLLYDMPIGLGEPHYAKIISIEKLKPLDVYPAGTNPLTFEPHPKAIQQGQERIERKQENGKWVTEIYATLIRSTITPDIMKAKVGDIVRIHLTNVEYTRDATHGFCIAEYNINASLEPGETGTIEFVADKPGVYAIYCTEFCSPLHLEMAGWLVIEP